MRKPLLLLICVIAALAVSAQNIDRYAVDGEIYFKFKDNAAMNFAVVNGVADVSSIPALQNAKADFKLKAVQNTFWQTKSDELHRVFRLSFDEKQKVNDLISYLKAQPEIEYAEKVPFFRVAFNPDDNEYNSYVGNRWHLDRINAEAAWDLCQGNSSIKIAVVDNAIDVTHPDLVNKVVLSTDLADGDNNPAPPQNTLVWSHGTHTSGLAAAQTNNSIGVASIGFNCSLICVKAGRDADGGQGATHMFEGITWAADNGANVISLSLGGPNYHITMQMVIDYAYNKGVVVVAAAGNNGSGDEDPNNVNYVGYPAACNHVIAVGATNGNDVKASFSEFGTWIDVMAPGGYQFNGGTTDLLNNRSVFSTKAFNSYVKMQGTSMACPITAGLCGLMLAADPNMTVEQVELYLKASCDNIESLQATAHQGMVGAGRINAFAAIQMVQANISTLYADFTSNISFIFENGSVNFTDQTTGTPTSWSWSFPGGNPSTSTAQNPAGIQYASSGTYDVTLIVSDGTNTDTITKPAFITVQVAAQSAWTEQASAFASMYRGASNMAITSNLNCWVTAVDGTTGAGVKEFTRTVNGGAQWTAGVMSITGSLAPANITAYNDNIAWVAMYPTSGAGGEIFKTTDGGATWTQVTTTAMFSNSASFLNVVHFFNENDGFCMGDPINTKFEIYYTTDGGANWTVVDPSTLPAVTSGEMGWTGVYDARGNTAYFGTNKGKLYKTTDKGMTWTVISNTGLTDVSDIAFGSENAGMAIQKVYNTSTGAITSMTVKLTQDGGANWSTVTPSGPFWKNDIAAVPGVPGKYFSVGTDGQASSSAKYGSSFSIDYGATWSHIDTGIQYISVCFLNDTIGWAGGFNLNATQGGIYKWGDQGTFVPAVESASEMVIYPNPASEFIHIAMPGDLNESEIVLVDMTGRVVMNRKISTAGEVTLDVSALPAGLYTCLVTSNGQVWKNRIAVQ